MLNGNIGQKTLIFKYTALSEVHIHFDRYSTSEFPKLILEGGPFETTTNVTKNLSLITFSTCFAVNVEYSCL